MGKAASKTIIAKPDAEALWWCGILGHTYVVLHSIAKGAATERCAGLETCDRDAAIHAARTTYREDAPAVYEKIGRGKWRRVAVALPKKT